MTSVVNWNTDGATVAQIVEREQQLKQNMTEYTSALNQIRGRVFDLEEASKDPRRPVQDLLIQYKHHKDIYDQFMGSTWKLEMYTKLGD